MKNTVLSNMLSVQHWTNRNVAQTGLKALFMSALMLAPLTAVNTVRAEMVPIGQVEMKSGDGSIIRGSDSIPVANGKTVVLQAKDTVQTSKDSGAVVTVGESDSADQFTLGEKTTFAIDEYVTEQEKPTRGLFSLLGGKVRSVVNSVKGNKDIKMRTSSATIGVKGTDFLTEVPNNEVTQVTTFQGEVSLRNLLGSLQKEVSIGSGNTSMVFAGGAPSSPLALSRESLLESARVIPASDTGRGSRVNARDLARDETNQAFSKSQFDRIVEQAARVKGSLIHVKINFPNE